MVLLRLTTAEAHSGLTRKVISHPGWAFLLEHKMPRKKNSGIPAKNLIDITGMRFGKLTVLKKAINTKGTDAVWECICDCGTKLIIHGSTLRKGQISCRKCRNHAWTHRLTNTRLYNIWWGIKGRCYCPTNEAYNSYGGRGIKMSEDWKNNPTAFYQWGMGNGYKPGLTIERIDNDGNYEPNNCKFIPRSEQAKNRRSSRFIECNGKKQILADWARETGIPQGTILGRLKLGWSMDRLFAPVVLRPYSEKDKEKHRKGDVDTKGEGDDPT
jgi:hypothetical protein